MPTTNVGSPNVAPIVVMMVMELMIDVTPTMVMMVMALIIDVALHPCRYVFDVNPYR